MPGFLTHYLIGMESWELLPENYIQKVIRSNNHAFLIGLQGNDLLSINISSFAKRGLSYKTDSRTVYNQEYAALFNNMLDHISSLSGREHEQEVCTAFAAGFLCYYTIDQMSEPFVESRMRQDLPLKASKRKEILLRKEIETTLDTVLLRTHCHMEPSQLNFEALTYASRRDLASLDRMMRYVIKNTYNKRAGVSEVTNGLKNIRKHIIYISSNARLKARWLKTITQPGIGFSQTRIYEDFSADMKDYTNDDGKGWYPYPGSPTALYLSYEDVYRIAQRKSIDFLESLDSCLSWGMNREELIGGILEFSPYENLMHST